MWTLHPVPPPPPPKKQKKEMNCNVCFPDFSGSTVLKEKGKILEEISLYHNTPGNTVYIKSGLTCMIRYFSTYNSLMTQSWLLTWGKYSWSFSLFLCQPGIQTVRSATSWSWQTAKNLEKERRRTFHSLASAFSQGTQRQFLENICSEDRFEI